MKFEVVGLPRSGQHAIATWLMAQMPSPSVFVNNSNNRPDYVWYRNGIRKKETLAFTPEDASKACVMGIGLEGRIGLADRTPYMSVFVLRDIKNHMASLIKHRTLRANWDEFFEGWKEYALLEIEEPNKDYPYMVVPFSLWHALTDERFRLYQHFEQITGQSTAYNDDARKDVMESGGGSSFDGRKFVGCGDKMDVLNRWKSVELPSIPADVLELNDEIFREIYEQRG